MSDEGLSPLEPKRTSLLAGCRLLVAMMPGTIRRKVRLAVVYSSFLAGLDFLSIVLLFPVFAYLTQGSSGGMTVPFVNIQLDKDSARWLAVVALGMMILRSVLTFLYRRWWLGVTADAESQTSDMLMRTYAYAPYRYHLSSLSTDLVARAVQHVYIVSQSGLVGIVSLMNSALMILGLCLALIYVQPLVGMAVGIYLLILGSVYIVLTRGLVRRLTARLQESIGQVYGSTTLMFRGIREITVFGLREPYLKDISQKRERMTATGARVALLQDVPKVFLEVILYVSVLGALAVLLSLTDPDKVLPVVALYVVAAMRMLPSLTSMLAAVSSVRSGAQFAQDLSVEMAEIEAMDAQPPLDVPIAASDAQLTLEDLSFRYDDDGPDVLHSVNVAIPFGTFVGVVGESGSGKSTLLSLLLGLLSPTGGVIRYGDARVVPNDAAWFEKVALLPQDVFVTHESLESNILAGQPHDEELLRQVIGASGLQGLVQDLPEGLQTSLAEGGARLSAGQRQRVGLARALYRRPEVLFLDEPTSALDSETEAHVMDEVSKLKGSMTIIAVAHRLNTLQGADTVLVLDAGRADSAGTFEDFLRNSPGQPQLGVAASAAGQ